MKVLPLQIADAVLLQSEPFRDERGVFHVFWERTDPSMAAISFAPCGAYHSHNLGAHVLRGMHYQESPHGQAKLVSCVRGAVWDVIVDLRPGSSTYLRWEALELREASGRSILVPRGCAHGFLTLQECSTVAYLIDGAYVPQAARTLRWNDPAIGIAWPVTDPLLSERDRSAPGYRT